MSGRARHWREGQLITNRKTDRRNENRRKPHEMPDYRLSFLLPGTIGFAVKDGAAAGFVGVTVQKGVVEVRGKNRDWVLEQAGKFVASIAKGRDVAMTATLMRDADEPVASGSPAEGKYQMTRDMVVVSGPSVVFLHSLKKPLIFPVK